MSVEQKSAVTDRDFVTHADIARFADERVNLKREDATSLREQANRLRDVLAKYVEEHPAFELKKILLSGSLAKGTALSNISDIDMGCYISSAAAPHAIHDLIPWLAKKLETAFPNFSAKNIKPKEYSVGVQFMSTGNEVDIVPILYEGDPEWRGHLISRKTGKKLMTSIPMHLEFTRKRKAANQQHFAQVVRLIKYWAGIRKRENDKFRCKSFMIELIVAHLADNGTPLDNYPEAMAAVFNFMATDQFKTIIAFRDYYDPKLCKSSLQPMHIWDPVNHENNVTDLYNEENKRLLIEAAIDAADAIDAAEFATTKGETLRYWQKVLGPTFSV